MRRIMRKATQNYIVFGSLFVLGLIEAVSGFALWLALPDGGGWRGGRGSLIPETFLSFTRHEWIDIHDWAAVAIMAVMIIHLALHWKWIVYMTRKVFQASQPFVSSST